MKHFKLDNSICYKNFSMYVVTNNMTMYCKKRNSWGNNTYFYAALKMNRL